MFESAFSMRSVACGTLLVCVALAQPGCFDTLYAPMSYSPDGQELVMVNMVQSSDQEEGKGLRFRLLFVQPDGEVETLDAPPGMIWGCPAYSPDGRTLFHLELPMPRKDTEAPATRPATRPAAGEAMEKVIRILPELPPPVDPDSPEEIPVRFVFRDARTRKIRRVFRLDVPANTSHGMWTPSQGDTRLSALTARPEFSPDGQVVYVCFAGQAMAIDPQQGRMTLLAAPAAVAKLSPDGKTLATLVAAGGETLLRLVSTDGRSTRYHRLGNKPIRDLAWRDAKCLLFLWQPDVEGKEGKADGK